MEVACDMKSPVGYWVQQVRANGETVAVKVLHAAAATSQLALGMSHTQRNAADAPESDG
jgi:hypothetical protein